MKIGGTNNREELKHKNSFGCIIRSVFRKTSTQSRSHKKSRQQKKKARLSAMHV